MSALLLMGLLWFFIDSNRFHTQSATSTTVTTTPPSGH